MGPVERRWRTSLTRREALASLAALVAGSPLLAAQRDPRPLRDHQRVPGFTEMGSVFDFEPVFFANVPRFVYDYTAHGADSEWTIQRNRDAFDWVDIVARPPVEPARVNTRTSVLGLTLDFPIFVAPSAGQVALHPDGEIGMHKAATAAKTPMIISNVSSQPVEKIVPAAAGPTWFQFYPRQSLEESRKVLEQAQTAGCLAVGMERHLPGAGRDEDRKVQREAEDAGACVDARGLDRLARNDVHPVEGVAIALDGPLRVGAVSRVVVHEPRDVGEEHRLEVEHRLHLGEAGHALVIAERAGIPLPSRQERRPRDERGEARQRLPPGQTRTPATFNRSHVSLPSSAATSGLCGSRPGRSSGERVASPVGSALLPTA